MFGCCVMQMLVQICFLTYLDIFSRCRCKNEEKLGENKHFLSLLLDSGRPQNACLAPLRTGKNTFSGTKSYKKL